MSILSIDPAYLSGVGAAHQATLQYDAANNSLAFSQYYAFQGTNYGYAAGAITAIIPTVQVNTISRFSFISDGSAVDVGDLTSNGSSLAGHSSSTHGYAGVGRFPFAADTNATSVRDAARTEAATSSSSAHGYTSGSNASRTTIDKFSFVSPANTTDVGDLTQSRYLSAGHSSSFHGYSAGGTPGGAAVNTIDRYPFSTDNNASDIGDLTQAREGPSGQSSFTHGYTSGGTNVIDKFPFASTTTSTDVGDLTTTRFYTAGQSSTTHGYSTGGWGTAPGFPTFYNDILKFSFTTDGNAVDIGSLQNTRAGSGQQH